MNLLRKASTERCWSLQGLIVRGMIRNWKNVHSDTAEGSLREIGCWLYTKHSGMVFFETLVTLREGWGFYYSSLKSKLIVEEMVVEEHHDRELELCDSDPELWIGLYHFDDSSSD